MIKKTSIGTKPRTFFRREYLVNAAHLADVTDDVKGQVKVKMLDDLAYLVLLRTTVVTNKNKSIKQHGSCLGHF